MASVPRALGLVSNLYAAAHAAERAWERERRAAVCVQAVVRMHQQRLRFRTVRRCAVAVQRVFRGFRGRMLVLALRIRDAERHRDVVFHCHARTIQRVFRGFLCRKYTSDFCAQKAYIARIGQTSEGVRQAALRAREEQEERLATEQSRALRSDFELAARNKRHLVSTAVCAGVLRPPLAPDGARTVFGTDVEEEIRALPVERKRFLRDVIPTGATAGGGAAATAGGASAKAGAPHSSSASATTRSAAAAREVAARTIAKTPYERTLQGVSEYAPSNRDVARRIEERVIAAVHGEHGAHFRVPQHVGRANAATTGYTGGAHTGR
jgi:hypothetical protein